MVIDIEENRCKSCELCVHACPKDVLEIGEKTNKMGYHVAQVKNLSQCIACGMCATICPDAAIELMN